METWTNIYSCKNAHEKAAMFQRTLLDKFHLFFPEKTLKINSDDQPWMTSKLKKLDRRRKRVYQRERRSEKWQQCDKIFKKEKKQAKSSFYKNIIAYLRQKKTISVVFKLEASYFI